MFYHRVVNTKQSPGHCRNMGVVMMFWGGWGGLLKSSCEAIVQVSLPPSILTAGERVSKSSFQQKPLLSGLGFHHVFPYIPRTLQLWPQSSFCTAWWEEVTPSGERGMQRCLCNVGYFCTCTHSAASFFRNVTENPLMLLKPIKVQILKNVNNI